MRKICSFLKPVGSERVSESQKLLRSAEKYSDPTFSLFWANGSYKKLFSLRSEILGLLDITLTAICQYSGSNTETLSLSTETKFSWKLKSFYRLFIAFLESKLNFEDFDIKKKKASIIPKVFLKLLTLKHVLT